MASPKIGDLMAGVIGDSNLNIKVKGSLKIGICYGYDNMVGENYRSFCKKFVRIERGALEVGEVELPIGD